MQIFKFPQKNVHKKTCPFCGTLRVIILTDKEQEDYFEKGKMVQDVFPDATPDQRELFMTGTCSNCWDEAFKEEE